MSETSGDDFEKLLRDLASHIDRLPPGKRLHASALLQKASMQIALDAGLAGDVLLDNLLDAVEARHADPANGVDGKSVWRHLRKVIP